MGSDMSWRQVTCCLRFRRRLQTRWRWWTRGWRATLIMEWKDQGGTAGGAIENSQTTGNRDATSGRQLKTPRTTPSAVTPPATATSTRSCDGEGEPAVNRQQGGDGADRQDLRVITSSQYGTRRRHEQEAMLQARVQRVSLVRGRPRWKGGGYRGSLYIIR